MCDHWIPLGFPLEHFREVTAERRDVVGKRTKGTKFRVVGFRFRNILDSRSSGDNTLRSTVNDYVIDVLGSRLNVDLNVRRVTLVMRHSALGEEDPLFLNINPQSDPGSSILAFIERLAQSGKVIRSSDPITFEFWIS